MNKNNTDFPANKPNALVIWGLIVLVTIGLSLLMSSHKVAVNEITYSEFIVAVKDGKVENVTFKGNEIFGKFKDNSLGKGTEFKTFGDTKSDYYLKLLGDNNLTPKYLPEDTESSLSLILINLLPFLLLIGIIYYITKGMKNSNSKVFGFGKLNLIDLNKNTSVKFKDVAGMDEAKDELTEIVDFLKNPKKYTELGGKIPKGALLVGPPGTGKTMVAKAAANEAGVSFFAISGSDFIEMFVGVGASRVRDLFEQARKSSPCIIFIDEIDAMAKQRSGNQFGSNSEMDQTLNQLLVEMDGIDEKNKHIIVLAATNRVDILDQALLRPGRFDRRVFIPLPDLHGREQILKSHSLNKKISKNVDFSLLARGTSGMSGADLANLLNESAITAAKLNKSEIDMESIEKAKDKILMGTERKSLVMNSADKEKTAVHEAGHAIITKVLKLNNVYKVSIIPRGQALGVTQIIPDDNQVSFSKKKAQDLICVLMGGRAAEDIKYQEYTSGASDDIRRATDIARRMVTEWGMSDKFGPMNISSPTNQFEVSNISPQTLRDVDDEIKKMLSECYERTKNILNQNIEKLNLISGILIQRETITGDDIDLIMGEKTT